MVCTYRIAVQMHEICEALQEKYNRSSYYYNYDNLRTIDTVLQTVNKFHNKVIK